MTRYSIGPRSDRSSSPRYSLSASRSVRPVSGSLFVGVVTGAPSLTYSISTSNVPISPVLSITGRPVFPKPDASRSIVTAANRLRTTAGPRDPRVADHVLARRARTRREESGSRTLRQPVRLAVDDDAMQAAPGTAWFDEHQRVDIHLARFAVDLYREPLGEQGLQHRQDFLPRGRLRRSCADVVALGTRPVGHPQDSSSRQPIRLADESLV